jgi:DNA-binding response OmpR family regulator
MIWATVLSTETVRWQNALLLTVPYPKTEPDSRKSGADQRVMKVLVADSDPNTIESLGMCCSIRWPYRELLSTEDPEELLTIIEQEAPDLVVLNTRLPKESGYAVCRGIRTFSEVPLIMIASGEEDGEIIRALESGANDCVTKTVNPLELLALIVALFRRTQRLPLMNSARPFISDDLYIDFDTYEVRKNGQEIKLTLTEFEILRCLVNNPRRVISHSQLACLIWGEGDQGSRSALKVHIQHLRHKLGESAGRPQYILNERSYGYKFAAG